VDEDTDRIDWSEECRKQMLVYQRKAMWLEDTLDKLAAWIGLKPGMTAVDVGCGLGHMGYTFWPYLGESGKYFGVDTTPDLLKDAEKTAIEWAEGGEVSFKVGDAYDLPLADGFADLVMCQALLIHLARPERALICNKGRVRSGRGDSSIGNKIPFMMDELGIIQIGIRQNDTVCYIAPPYGNCRQPDLLDSVKQQWLDETRYRTLGEQKRKHFIAGGGFPAESARYQEVQDRIRDVFQRQIEDGTYFACGAGRIYIVRGRKPV
jgi:SAM-dependent methyltransferase